MVIGRSPAGPDRPERDDGFGPDRPTLALGALEVAARALHRDSRRVEPKDRRDGSAHAIELVAEPGAGAGDREVDGLRGPAGIPGARTSELEERAARNPPWRARVRRCQAAQVAE